MLKGGEGILLLKLEQPRLVGLLMVLKIILELLGEEDIYIFGATGFGDSYFWI